MLKIIVDENGEKYSTDDLIEILKILRSPGGCPWDREQTNKSIRNDTLEDAYEVAEAIDNDDAEALCEELGDLLLQVIFHSRIAEEDGRFDYTDVVDGICRKLILRHPHVFGKEKVESSDEVLDLWNAIKKEEKNQTSYTETLKSVPVAFPALMRSAKVQKRALKAGFVEDNPTGCLKERLDALNNAIDQNSNVDTAYGELLFSLAGLQNHIGVNAEQALATATDSFIARFCEIEKSGKLKKVAK